MRPLSARRPLPELLPCDDDGEGGTGDDGLRSSVTCTSASAPEAFGSPHDEQNRAVAGSPLPQ